MMTFEEFERLASNPPRKDEPTVFKVSIYCIDTDAMDADNEG